MWRLTIPSLELTVRELNPCNLRFHGSTLDASHTLLACLVCSFCLLLHSGNTSRVVVSHSYCVKPGFAYLTIPFGTCMAARQAHSRLLEPFTCSFPHRTTTMRKIAYTCRQLRAGRDWWNFEITGAMGLGRVMCCPNMRKWHIEVRGWWYGSRRERNVFVLYHVAETKMAVPAL